MHACIHTWMHVPRRCNCAILRVGEPFQDFEAVCRTLGLKWPNDSSSFVAVSCLPRLFGFGGDVSPWFARHPTF